MLPVHESVLFAFRKKKEELLTKGVFLRPCDLNRKLSAVRLKPLLVRTSAELQSHSSSKASTLGLVFLGNFLSRAAPVKRDVALELVY